MRELRMLVITHGRHLRWCSERFRDSWVAQGRAIKIEFLDVLDAAEIPQAVNDAGPADALLIEPELSPVLLAKTPMMPLPVSLANAADLFIWKKNQWDANLILGEAIHDVIVKEGKALDLTQSAFVTGEGAELRVAASVCLRLGFQNVRLIGEDEDRLAEQARLLSATFGGARISALPAHELTMQTVNATLLVNTLELTDRPEIASDLSYFNFMKRGGIVLDLKTFDKMNPMLEEAERAALKVLPPAAFCDAFDRLLAAKLGLS